MSEDEPTFSLGVEEEYFLVDLDTRDLAVDPPPELMADCQRELGKGVASELLRCQIEIGTPVCRDLAEARRHLARMRETIATCAERYGLAPMAASTHPFAEWDQQRSTPRERYDELSRNMQVVARRLMIGGMHVHIGVEDEALRFDLLDQLPYFLPHLLALSTSSPFWRGQVTGLHSYRLSVFGELPRTGMPPSFSGPDEFRRTVAALVKAGEIEDATMIWWDLRPSVRFPTLEMRIADVCPRVDDAIAVVALYRCITRMLYRLRRNNQRWRHYSTFLLNENRWLAQRNGVGGRLIDFGKGEPVPFAGLIEELVALTAEDAAFFGCEEELARVRTIAREGTGSDRQLRVHAEAIANGASEREALAAVVDHLIAETRAGCAGDSDG